MVDTEIKKQDIKTQAVKRRLEDGHQYFSKVDSQRARVKVIQDKEEKTLQDKLKVRRAIHEEKHEKIKLDSKEYERNRKRNKKEFFDKLKTGLERHRERQE